MRALALIFVLLAVYALAQGLYAAAALSAGGALLVAVGLVVMDRKEQAGQRDPKNARLPVDYDNRCGLAESECECIWIPAELADLQAAGQLANSNEDPR